MSISHPLSAGAFRGDEIDNRVSQPTRATPAAAQEQPGEFDAYLAWFAIPPEARHPFDYYLLLGLRRFESDPEAIIQAAAKRIQLIPLRLSGEKETAATKVISQITAARDALLDPKQRQKHDNVLRKRMLARRGRGRDGKAPPPVARIAPPDDPMAALSVSSPLAPTRAPSATPQRRIRQKQEEARRKTRNRLIGGTLVLGTALAIGSVANWVRSKMGKGPQQENTPTARVLHQEELAAAPIIIPPEEPPPPPRYRPQLVDMPQPKEEPPQVTPEPEQVARVSTEPPPPAFPTPPKPEIRIPSPVKEDPAAKEAAKKAAEAREAQLKAEQAQKFREDVRETTKDVLNNYGRLDAQTIMKGAAGVEKDKAALRIALYSVAMEKAALAGNMATMNEACGEMRRAGESHGFTAHDAFALKADALRRIGENPRTLGSMTGTQRLAMATDIATTCIPQAYRDDDLPLAKELRALAHMRILNGVSSGSFPPDQRKKAVDQLANIRKRLGEEIIRQNKLQPYFDDHTQGLDATGKPQSPAAHYNTAIWQIMTGRSDEALPHLAQCPIEVLAKAASLEMKGPRTAEELLACAQKWIFAGGSKVSYAWEWYDRASKLLGRAQGLRPTPTGQTRLDIAAAVTYLERRGVVVWSSGGGQEKVAQPEEAFPKGKWVDVTRTLDPSKQRDLVIKGDWKLEKDGSLVVQPAQGARVLLPIEFNGNYDFEFQVELERLRGTESEAIILPFGGATIIIGGWPGDGGFTYIADIKGQGPLSNPKAVKGKMAPGKYVFITKVQRKDGGVNVIFIINGREQFRWEGPVADITPNGEWEMPQHNMIGVGSYDSYTRYKNMQIRVISGNVAALGEKGN